MTVTRVRYCLLFLFLVCPCALFAQIISCPAVLVDPQSIQQACVGDQIFLDIFIDDEGLGEVTWTFPDGSTEVGFNTTYTVPELDICNHTQTIGWVLYCDGLEANVDGGTVNVNTFVLPSEIQNDGCTISVVGGDCPDIVVTGGNNESGNTYNAQEGETGTVTFDISNTAAPADCNSSVQLNDSFDCVAPSTNPGSIALKVMLEAYVQVDGTMRTDLAFYDLLPTTQPFNVFPYYYFGMQSVDTHDATTVDWLLVELRDPDNPSQLVARQALLLRNDGAVVDVEGNEFVHWNSQGNYHVVVKHRSHLGIQTAQSIDNSDGTSYDFTSAIDQAAGNEQQKITSGVAAMLTGDYDNSGTINFFDFILWLSDNNVTGVYNPADGDGNGTINFFDFIRYYGNINKVSVPSIP